MDGSDPHWNIKITSDTGIILAEGTFYQLYSSHTFRIKFTNGVFNLSTNRSFTINASRT